MALHETEFRSKQTELRTSQEMYEYGRGLYNSAAEVLVFKEGPDLVTEIESAQLTSAQGRTRLTWRQLADFYEMPEGNKLELASMLYYNSISDRHRTNDERWRHLLWHSGKSDAEEMLSSLRSTTTQAFQWSVITLLGPVSEKAITENSQQLTDFAGWHNFRVDDEGIEFGVVFIPNEFGFSDYEELPGKKIKYGRLLGMNPHTQLKSAEAGKLFREMGLETLNYRKLVEHYGLDIRDMILGEFRQESRFLPLNTLLLTDLQKQGFQSDVIVSEENARSLEHVSNINLLGRRQLDNYIGKSPLDLNSNQGQAALKALLASGHGSLLMETSKIFPLPDDRAAIVEAGRPYYKLVPRRGNRQELAIFAAHRNARLYDPGTPLYVPETGALNTMRKELVLPYIEPEVWDYLKYVRYKVSVWVGMNATHSGQLRPRSLRR